MRHALMHLPYVEKLAGVEGFPLPILDDADTLAGISMSWCMCRFKRILYTYGNGIVVVDLQNVI